VTATFRLLYVFIVIEHQTRRIVHCNVTTIPITAWTLQQLRESIPSDHGYRFLIHERDGICSPNLDQSISHMGLRVLWTTPRSPKANSLCERVIGTLRRECLDYLIPLTEFPLRCITKNGQRITTKVGHIPVSAMAYRTLHLIFLSPNKNFDTVCHIILGLRFTLSSVDYIMNTACCRKQHEYLRSTALSRLSASHRHSLTSLLNFLKIGHQSS